MPKTVKVLSVIEVRSLANIEGFHAVGGAPRFVFAREKAS